MIVRPITRDAANDVIAKWHSHRFALAAWGGAEMLGVPASSARVYETSHPNAASFLLGAAWRACKARGNRYLPGLYVPTTEIVDRMRWEVP